MDDEKQTLQDANNIVKADITLLFIQTRGWAGLFFRRLSRNDGDIMTAYSEFISYFFQLYMMFKYNAEFTGKVKEWKKKTETYDKLFKRIQDGENVGNILTYWNLLVDDMNQAGIYNLTETEYEGR